MKKVFFLMAISMVCNLSFLKAQDLAVNDLQSHSKDNPSLLVWNKTVHDFGTIPQGIPVETEFTLTNESHEILLLKEVKTSCGCTVAGYSQDPILPGESTQIKATYNAKKEGAINKIIKVYTSQSDDYIPLKLKGEVVKKDK